MQDGTSYFVPLGDEAFHILIYGKTDVEIMASKPTPPTASSSPETLSFPPVLFCIHGAGMSALSFHVFAQHLLQLPPAPPFPNYASALSPFSSAHINHPTSSSTSGFHDTSQQSDKTSVGESLTTSTTSIRICSVDLRCHGDSTWSGGESSLSIDKLLNDATNILHYLHENLFSQVKGIYLVGHSLGGAIVARLGHVSSLQSWIRGCILLDIVEETAILSLKHMPDFLRRRPEVFNHWEEAANWFIKQRIMNCKDNAYITVRPLLKQSQETKKWVWKTDLKEFETVWQDWFTGINHNFISLTVPKLLCVSTIDRLDTELIIAQMQGKFQFEVLRPASNRIGHYLMDDAPDLLASKVSLFVNRIEYVTKIICS